MSLTKRQKRIKRNAQRIRRGGCRGVIEWPDFESEFEVQANLYGALRDAGYAVRGCVLAWCDDPDPHRVYFDLVVFDHAEGKALAVIECKNDQCDLMELRQGTRQHRRYHMFGVPVLKCSGTGFIGRTIDRLKALSSPAVSAFLADEPLTQLAQDRLQVASEGSL